MFVYRNGPLCVHAGKITEKKCSGLGGNSYINVITFFHTTRVLLFFGGRSPRPKKKPNFQFILTTYIALQCSFISFQHVMLMHTHFFDSFLVSVSILKKIALIFVFLVYTTLFFFRGAFFFVIAFIIGFQYSRSSMVERELHIDGNIVKNI